MPTNYQLEKCATVCREAGWAAHLCARFCGCIPMVHVRLIARLSPKHVPAQPIASIRPLKADELASGVGPPRPLAGHPPAARPGGPGGHCHRDWRRGTATECQWPTQWQAPIRAGPQLPVADWSGSPCLLIGNLNAGVYMSSTQLWHLLGRCCRPAARGLGLGYTYRSTVQAPSGPSF